MGYLRNWWRSYDRIWRAQPLCAHRSLGTGTFTQFIPQRRGSEYTAFIGIVQCSQQGSGWRVDYFAWPLSENQATEVRRKQTLLSGGRKQKENV